MRLGRRFRSRLVHWSAPNASSRERRLLINSYGAAAAFSLAADSTGSPLVGTVVRGQPARRVRREAGEMQAPPRLAGPYTSIYELQTAATADGMR